MQQDPSLPHINLITSLIDHNWYAVSVASVMIITQLARKYASDLWQKIPNGLRFLPPVLSAAALAFVHGFAKNEVWTQAGIDALNSIWQIAIPAMGGAAALKESPLPWDGGSGGVKALPVAVAPPEPSIAPIGQDDRPTPVDGHGPVLPPSDPPPPPEPPQAA